MSVSRLWAWNIGGMILTGKDRNTRRRFHSRINMCMIKLTSECIRRDCWAVSGKLHYMQYFGDFTGEILSFSFTNIQSLIGETCSKSPQIGFHALWDSNRREPPCSLFQQNSSNQFHFTFLFSLLGYIPSLKPNIRMACHQIFPRIEVSGWLLC